MDPTSLDALLAGVRQRIQHLVEGLSDDDLALAVPGLPGTSVGDVAARVAGAAGDGQDAAALLVEAVTMEHDLRTALDVPGFRDDASVLAALDVLADALSERIAARGLPALRITVEQWGTIAGRGPARHCLVADRFDFVRGMAGRRSARQVERWNWDTSAGDYLQVLTVDGVFPDADVRERDPRVPHHMQDFDLRH